MVLICVAYIYNEYNENMTYVTSDIDGKKYLVRDVFDKQHAANMLARIREKMATLSNYLYDNRDKYKNNIKYIEQLNSKIHNSVIIESGTDAKYTSYSVNKGQQLVFCIRSRDLHTKNKMHGLNLIMYVVLHEMAHVACPEYGHTPLFKQIFAFITTIAIEQKIYAKMEFQVNPTEYCGLTITDSII
jgi:predicted metal-dependent hydrolase